MTGLLRAGLWVLAAGQGAVSLWALLAPAAFYDDFPWVALDPPYNEHLVRDFGAVGLALTVVLTAAAVRPSPPLVRAVLGGFLAFAAAHLVFHATHLGHFGTADAVSATAFLSVAVLLPAALLGLSLRGARR